MAGIPGAGTDSFFYDKFTKDFYMPGWSDLVNNQTTTVKYMRKRQVPFVGRRAVIALRTGRTSGVQAINPSSFNVTGGVAGTIGSAGAPGLPQPGYQQVDNAFVKPCIIMLAIGIPQDTIDIAVADKGAFMDVLDFEMMGAKADAANYEDKICYKGASDTGLADITAVGGSTPNFTVTVDNVFPFFKGQRVSFYQGTGGSSGAHRVTVTITAIDRATYTFTHDGGVTGGGINALVTDVVTTNGARPKTGVAAIDLTNFEPWGFEPIINTVNPTGKDLDGDSKYLRVDRTLVAEWQSQLKDAGTGPFTYEGAQEVLDNIADNSGGNANIAFTHKALRRKIALKYAFGVTTEPTTGTAGLTWKFNDTIRTQGGIVPWTEDKHGQEGDDWMRLNAEIPIVLDRYASHDFGPPGAPAFGTIWFLDTRRWYEAVVTNWKFWAPEGRIFRESQNNNAFGVIAHAYKFYQRVCDAPNAQGKYYNIAA